MSDSSDDSDSGDEDGTAMYRTAAYLLGAFSGVFVFVLHRRTPRLRFHAAQSILVTIAAVGLFIALTFVQFLLTFVPGVGETLSILFSLVYPLYALGAIGVWAWLLYKAATEPRYQLPVVGPVARGYR